MRYLNIKHPDQTVSFAQAVVQGLGRDRGLFFPEAIPSVDIPKLLAMDFVPRSIEILSHFVGDAIAKPALGDMLERAFNFPLIVRPVVEDKAVVELFHGPSLAFKDFGARFMAECLAHLVEGPMTILTATSGDTGAAVAHAFRDQPGIRVVILYPDQKISQLQEKLFCTLGGNIQTLAVQSDFDACQDLVKRAFDDPEITSAVSLNSANSINIARLLAQVCYYFEAVARAPRPDPIVISVPSGNFGNLTAGLIARAMGLPIQRFVAATNANDTVPRFLASGRWEPHPTVATLTNAMDISAPNNFPRVLYLAEHFGQTLSKSIESFSIDDDRTRDLVRELFALDYLAEPHTALAYGAAKQSLREGEQGLFLATAHPAKFREVIEQVTGQPVELPAALREVADQTVLSQVIAPDFQVLKSILLATD